MSTSPLVAVLKLVPPTGNILEGEVNGSWIDDIDGTDESVLSYWATTVGLPNKLKDYDN